MASQPPSAHASLSGMLFSYHGGYRSACQAYKPLYICQSGCTVQACFVKILYRSCFFSSSPTARLTRSDAT